jgi:hypothetical protein
MLMAGGMGSLQHSSEEPLRVMWYDTEQSEESTQDILKKRIVRMASPSASADVGNGDLLQVFNVRGEPWKERMPLLEAAVTHYRPDLVIVDGIRDLVNDINDGCLAQEVVEGLMRLAAETGCCMVCVLHQNKGSEDHNLRGWIGTELTNKAFEVYACEKDANRLFSVEQTHTRKYDITEKFYYSVDSDGLPRQVGGSSLPTEQAGKSASERLCDDYVIHHDDDSWEMDLVKLFSQAFHEGETVVRGSELRTRVMTAARISSFRFYNRQLDMAVEQKIVERYSDKGLVLYRLAPF